MGIKIQSKHLKLKEIMQILRHVVSVLSELWVDVGVSHLLIQNVLFSGGCAA